MIKESITVDDVVTLLNEALGLDREAIDTLVGTRVLCNSALASHPTIQVMGSQMTGGPQPYRVGLLGVLNGLFGIDDKGFGPIAAVFDDPPDPSDDKILTRFQRTKGLEHDC